MNDFCGLMLFLCWLHGRGPTVRALGRALVEAADRIDPPAMLRGRQLGAVMAIAAAERRS